MCSGLDGICASTPREKHVWNKSTLNSLSAPSFNAEFDFSQCGLEMDCSNIFMLSWFIFYLWIIIRSCKLNKKKREMCGSVFRNVYTVTKCNFLHLFLCHNSGVRVAEKSILNLFFNALLEFYLKLYTHFHNIYCKRCWELAYVSKVSQIWTDKGEILVS